ncbi:MAG: copper chaperone PCu(A)C [Alphaproteobacteria bacterium]|nr:copper chaperone PCu(A)C [Alphaproteobacteria bacterium]
MKKNFKGILFSFCFLITSLLACPEMHGSFKISDQSIVFLKGAEVGAGYLTISQTTETPDKLIAVKMKTETEESKGFMSRLMGLFSNPNQKGPHVELHDHVPTTEDPNVLTMKRIKDGIVVPGAVKDSNGKLKEGAPVKFEKNGKHLMLYNFPESIRNGDKLELVLTFEKAGDIAVTLPIASALSTNEKPCPHHH